MGDGNKRKVNKNRLCSSCSTPVGTDPAIFCDSCGSLTHGSCAQLSKEKIELLEQIDGAIWFCTSCRPTIKATLQIGIPSINANIENCLTTIKETVSQSSTRNEALTTEISNRFDELRDICTETKSTLQQNLADMKARAPEPQHQLRTNHTSYAGAVGHPQTSNNHTVEKLQRQRKPENILIVVNSKKFNSSIQIKKEFAKHYPLKRLVHAFNTTRGNVHLEFASKEETDNVYDSWQPNYLGDASSVRKITNTEKPNRAVIIKGVPKELTEQEIQNSLNEQFDGSKGTRFVKRDTTVLGTVKIVFKTDDDVQKALEHGLFIDMIYYSPSLFIQKEIQIIRCFKCQKFGHVSPNCKSETKCGHCSGEHSFQNCENKTETPKCANCGGIHPANSQSCDAYQRQLALVFNSRGIQPPNAGDSQTFRNG